MVYRRHIDDIPSFLLFDIVFYNEGLLNESFNQYLLYFL